MTRDEAYAALRNADAAGDAEGAQKLAQYIQQLPDDDQAMQEMFPNGPDGGMAVSVEGEIPKDDSALTGFVGGVLKPFDNAVTALEKIPGVKAANDQLAEWTGLPGGEEAVAGNDAMRANNSRTGFQMLGNIAATLPLAALPGGALTQGAAGGALLSDAETPMGVAGDALLGAAGGKVGELALRGVAGTVAPQLSQNLRTLINEGVSVTPGQMGRASGSRMGNFVAATEDKLMSVPVTGDIIKNSRRTGFDQFGRATVNRALEPIGMALPRDVSGRRAVQYAGDRLGDAYDAVLPRLTATGDTQFVNDLAAIHQEAANMLPARQEQFNNILGGLGRFWTQGANLDGRALKEIETRIGERVRRAALSTDADQRELGDRLGDVLASVRDLAARQNPDEAETLSAINRGWKSLTQVERAAGNSSGDITAAGYSQAVKQSSDTARRRGYARGEALNQDLSDAASEILPSGVPDSGTAGRLLSADMLNPLTLGTVAMTLPAQLAAQGTARVLSRDPSQASRQIADLIRLGAPRVGAPAAAITTGTMHSLTN